MGMDLERLEDRIRHLASEGMGIKRDLLPLYADQEYMGELIRYLAEPFRGKVDCVCARNRWDSSWGACWHTNWASAWW